MKHLRSLAWRLAPTLCQAISVRLPTLRAYRRYGWRRRRQPSIRGPVTIAGFHGAVLGLGEGARSATSALRAAGVPVRAWDISEMMGHARRLEVGDATPPPAGPGTLITYMNPPELIRLITTADVGSLEGKYIIGYWAWELSRIPRSWKSAFRYVDEVWALSTFTAEAIRAAAPRSLSVKVMPIAVPVSHTLPDRDLFGFEPDTVIVLCAFDFRSTLARKNPLASLEAFRKATAHTHTPAKLVFKTVGGSDAPAALATLKAAIGALPDVVLLTESLSAGDRDRLLASCDILLSLHRSEGFGLLPAEAMAAGKPVVATAFSGNMDFMDEDSAALASYTLVDVEDSQGIYALGQWAEADTTAAGLALAALIDDPARRAELGARGRAMVEARLAPSVVADLMRDALGDTSAREPVREH